MVGIESYGIYIPLWRLDLSCTTEGGRGEKAIANYDEDSLTMGVAAATNCLKDIDRNTVDGLFFASSTFPYKEKQNSVTVATALDLRNDILTADFANSLRAGTVALKMAIDCLKAGTAKRILVVAADMRISMPGSDFEKEFGDGAAAFLIGSEEVKAVINDFHSISDEIFDVWRTDADKFVRTWEERFTVEEGYFRVLPQAISVLMKRNKLSNNDISKAALYGPNARRHSEIGKSLGFTTDQIKTPLFDSIGNTGAACSLMVLASAFEEAKQDDNILLANYGSGVDAFLIKIVGKFTSDQTLFNLISSKAVLKDLKDYKRYLHRRGLIEMAVGRRRPPTPSPSVTCLWREQDENLRLRGVKCKECGMVQFPPQVICYKCHNKDRFDSYSFYNKKATLVTYTEDHTFPTPDPPQVLAVVDFNGGGRMMFYMTDKGDRSIEIGMPVELTFRKLFTTEGIHNYSWKGMPAR